MAEWTRETPLRARAYAALIGKRCAAYQHDQPDGDACSCACHTPAYIANREREAEETRQLFATALALRGADRLPDAEQRQSDQMIEESAEQKAKRLESAIRAALDASDWLPNSIRIWDSEAAYDILSAALAYEPSEPESE